MCEFSHRLGNGGQFVKMNNFIFHKISEKLLDFSDRFFFFFFFFFFLGGGGGGGGRKGGKGKGDRKRERKRG